jgi:hypothetical protein
MEETSCEGCGISPSVDYRAPQAQLPEYPTLHTLKPMEEERIDYSTWVYAVNEPDCVEIHMREIVWKGSHESEFRLRVVKTLRGQPSETTIENAVRAVLQDPKYFRTCKACKNLTHDSYMHDEDYCMGCAPSELGVLY